MRDKALENLNAARQLIEQEVALPNSAASRAYYAAYHACWYALERQHYAAPVYNGKRYWRHDTFPVETLRSGLLNEDQSEDLADLYGQRVIADYYPEGLDREHVEALITMAERLVRLVLRDG